MWRKIARFPVTIVPFNLHSIFIHAPTATGREKRVLTMLLYEGTTIKHPTFIEKIEIINENIGKGKIWGKGHTW